MKLKVLICAILICASYFYPNSLFSQIPAKVFEILDILVDGCDGGNEGKNEMILFQIGPNPVNVTNLRVDGAGSSGVIMTGKWPNTANPWRGIATPPAETHEIDSINLGIQNCGKLIEPPGGILPAGKKVLMITSTAWNPNVYSFSTLGDTLYIIFQNAGNTAGHFVNYGTPSSNRTLVLVNVPTGGSDTVIYDRSLLVKQNGQIGAQDGGAVKYTFSGVPTYYNNGCTAPFTPLSAAWTNPGVVCQTSPPLDLNTLITGLTGGSWSGTGVTGHLFDPAGLLGNISISYTAGNLPCTVSDTQTIQVVTAPDASWTNPAPVCESSVPVDLSTLITGNTGGTWTGTGVTGNMFNPAGLSGNISVTYSVGSSPCISTQTNSIQIIPNADSSWTNPGIVCESSPPIDLNTLITGTPGGTWSGTGVSGTTFYPSGLSGNVNVIYTVGTAPCTTSLKHTLQVVSMANAAWTSPGTICQSSPLLNLNAFITGNIGGTWSGTGITDSIFDPAGLNGNISITYKAGNPPCNDSITHIIQVNLNANASWTNPGVACPSDPPITLSTLITGNTGGTWSGTGITNPITGLFNPSVAGTGVHLIIYTISGPCGAADSAYITVTSLADATISPAGPYCSGAPPVLLHAATAGGTWTGTGITNAGTGQFSPSVAGAGSFNIIYTISGGCGNADTATIIVNQTANATITPAGPFCETATPVYLTAANSGGVWNGDGIVNTSAGLFDPGVAGVGTHQIDYSILGTCGASDSIMISVLTQADATIIPAGPFCSNSPDVTLHAVTPGGTWSGIGITNASAGTFSPSTAGVGSINITYTIGGICGDTKTIAIIVNQVPDAGIHPAGPLCVTSAPFNLIANTPGGIWSGDGITSTANGTFDPALAGIGNHLITYFISGSCADTGTTTITVDSLPNANILPAGPYCDNVPPLTLAAATAGGSWSGSGITNTAVGTFDPSIAGAGVHSIVYHIAGICSNSDTAQIIVLQSPNVNITATGETCTGASDGTAMAVPAGADTSYLYHWNNAATTATITALAPGQYNVTVSGTDGCVYVGHAVSLASATPCPEIVPVLYVPNVFTPNGDNVNDVLYVRGQGIKTLSMVIFDRWGEKVFETTDLAKGWDGTYRGKPMDPAVYVYNLKAEFTNGSSVKKKGNITLTR